MGIIGLLGSVILAVFMIIVFIKWYKNMSRREKDRFSAVSSLPTIVYRKWYAAVVPVFGILGAVLFNLISLSDTQRGVFDNIVYSPFETTCIFAGIGFYMTSVLAAGVLFVLRLTSYGNNKNAAVLIIFSVPIGMALFPIYYIYNLVCAIAKKRTVLN